MTYREPELKAALAHFDKLLNDGADNVDAVLSYKSFLRSFLRVRVSSLRLPTGEIMAIIQHKRPEVFNLLKQHFADDLLFTFLTNIDMEYSQADKSLSEIKRLIE